jgi:hypothetical protein
MEAASEVVVEMSKEREGKANQEARKMGSRAALKSDQARGVGLGEFGWPAGWRGWMGTGFTGLSLLRLISAADGCFGGRSGRMGQMAQG